MPTDRGTRTIEKVLSMLEKNIGMFVSGADMADSIGISRNAVWKAIRELRQRGYCIESITNKGYRLSDRSDIISAEGIKAYIDPERASLADNIIIFESIDSTNDRAKELAVRGAEHGTCIVAARQEGGRGRKDHRFYSPEGGIYMSVILAPDRILFSKNDAITAWVGVSVCKAIAGLTGLTPTIQGINDLYLDGKKICGILIESGSEFDSGTLQWIVVGIGINFDPDITEFPEELREKAAGLFAPGRGEISKNRLIAAILENIGRTEYADEKAVMKEYKRWR